MPACARMTASRGMPRQLRQGGGLEANTVNVERQAVGIFLLRLAPAPSL